MRKKMLFCMTMVLAVSAMSLAIDAHWHPVLDPNTPAPTTIPSLWSVGANWSTGIAPNAADQVVWLATANTAPCLVPEGTWQIDQVKMGEGSDGSANGHLIVKGILNTKATGNWQGVGAWGGNTGTLEVDGGQFNTYDGGHMWCGNQGNGTLIVRNGGQINIGVALPGDTTPNDTGGQLGLGWDGTTGTGRAFICDGLLSVNAWNTSSINAKTPSFIDIERGTLSIGGYRITSINYTDATAVDKCAQDGRIRGFADAKFTKKLNIDNPGDDRQNDIINNVLLTWDGARTLVTAIHPQQPAPYFNDVFVPGNIEFAWNNWDPNHPGDAVTVDLWLGTDPNKFGPNYVKKVIALDVTGQARSSQVIDVPAAGKYYWQVDTTNGAGSFKEGDLFWFETVTYREPSVAVRSIVTTMDLLPAAISATVTLNSAPLTEVTFALLTGDLQFPAGANAVLTDTTTNMQNPTATLTTDKGGIYKVKLTVSDGTTVVEKVIEVNVYADPCQAKKGSPSGWVANYYDRNSDCTVNIVDFAQFALAWLNDTTMQVQETLVKDVILIPQSVFESRIEAESVAPDAVSDAPVTEDPGVRIVSEGGATGGGQALGYTGGGTWAQYQITVPAAGVYDVYYSICTPQTTTVLNFGDGTTVDKYGSVGPLPTFGGWGNYGVSVDKGALTFDAAGTYTVKITWTNEANVDWFTLVQQ